MNIIRKSTLLTITSLFLASASWAMSDKYDQWIRDYSAPGVNSGRSQKPAVFHGSYPEVDITPLNAQALQKIDNLTPEEKKAVRDRLRVSIDSSGKYRLDVNWQTRESGGAYLSMYNNRQWAMNNEALRKLMTQEELEEEFGISSFDSLQGMGSPTGELVAIAKVLKLDEWSALDRSREEMRQAIYKRAATTLDKLFEPYKGSGIPPHFLEDFKSFLVHGVKGHLKSDERKARQTMIREELKGVSKSNYRRWLTKNKRESSVLLVPLCHPCASGDPGGAGEHLFLDPPLKKF